MADPLEELKRLLRRLFEAWEAWIESDQWAGPEYDALAATIEALRRQLEEEST
ncbi:MAG TPA: hypothetical protein VK009_19300 [Chloroflexota bacterium]|nr:hypothetical protein [Chloroflexota bacterium]